MGKGAKPKRQDTGSPKAGGAARRRGEALAARVTKGWGALVSRADKGAERLRDSARSESFDYEREVEVDLVPGQNFVVDFRAEAGGFIFK